MAIETVDLPIINSVFFHSYVNVYQRVIGTIMGYIYSRLSNVIDLRFC